MNILEANMPYIHALCEAHKVDRLYAFGSVLTDRFNEESDVDLIVCFSDSIEFGDYSRNYFKLVHKLEDTLHRKVDLLEEKAIKNPYFKKEVFEKRKLVYGHLL